MAVGRAGFAIFEEVAEAHAGAAEDRLGVHDGDAGDFGDFVVLVTVNVVKNDGELIADRERVDSALEADGIERDLRTRIGEEGFKGIVAGIVGVGAKLVERRARVGILAEVHQDGVDGDAMEPGGKGRVAAEEINFAKYCQEDFLGEVFGGSSVFDHAKAEGEDAAAVTAVKFVECDGIAELRRMDERRFGGIGGVGPTGRALCCVGRRYA